MWSLVFSETAVSKFVIASNLLLNQLNSKEKALSYDTTLLKFVFAL